MQPIGLLYSGVANLGDSGNILYRLGAQCPRLKLRLRMVPKGLCSFRPKSPLEVGRTCVSTFEPVRTNGNSKSDQVVALGQIAKDGFTIDPVLHDRTLVFDRDLRAHRKLLSLAMRQ